MENLPSQTDRAVAFSVNLGGWRSKLSSTYGTSILAVSTSASWEQQFPMSVFSVSPQLAPYYERRGIFQSDSIRVGKKSQCTHSERPRGELPRAAEIWLYNESLEDHILDANITISGLLKEKRRCWQLQPRFAARFHFPPVTALPCAELQHRNCSLGNLTNITAQRRPA